MDSEISPQEPLIKGQKSEEHIKDKKMYYKLPTNTPRPGKKAAPRRLKLALILVILAVSLFYLLLPSPFTSLSNLRSEAEDLLVNPEWNTTRRPSASSDQLDPGQKRRVAIIGAGASGSAASFFLNRAIQEVQRRGGKWTGEELEIVIFEKSSYIGGRSTTVHPHSDPTLPPIELGASIFVDANFNMMKAVNYFGLSLQPWLSESAGEDDSSMTGIWDGNKFIFTTSGSGSWWDVTKALWRYGYTAPTRTKAFVSKLTGALSQLYSPTYLFTHGPYTSVEILSSLLGYTSLTSQSAFDLFASKSVGVGKKWVEEVIDASARVNYAQDVRSLHGLVGGVSMAAAGASSVEGGNWRIFEAFVKDSNADVRLNTEVVSVLRNESDAKWVVKSRSAAVDAEITTNKDIFDAVFFGAPYHFSGINAGFDDKLTPLIPEQEYVKLYVTLLTTTSPTPVPTFFNLSTKTKIPQVILTSSSSGAYIPFQSITYHGQLPSRGGQPPEYVVKIFSLEPTTDAFILSIFGVEPTWLLRKTWHSYPVMPPRSTFAPILPFGEEDRTFLYMAAQEAWISTMETQVLSGRNAVALWAESVWGLESGSEVPCEDLNGKDEGWEWVC